MHQYQILYWRDIPAQGRVFDGRKPVSRTMPAHFQGESDRVAMAEGLEGSDAYLDQWHWTERLEREGEEDIQQVLDAQVCELEKEHDRLAELP